MAEKIRLNGKEIELTDYKDKPIFAEGVKSGARDVEEITVSFNVTKDVYSETAGLLYEGTLDVEVPEKNLAFRGEIINFYSGIVNLYEAEDNETADEYTVTFKNVGNIGA
ncbi:DUF3219 family protein [Salinicoccus kekensis]|uniref:Uncharacterized protein DUF3219 n=1 Tax=Salinicoccus kekensis TaxID=714307 RepID=A0A285USI7_9STAP|nr:DUF3219 family protein [Salinicoccus kekensis]SOC44743.1 uncharacterized protein DUF3219 [Salinicoccus kekensis]